MKAARCLLISTSNNRLGDTANKTGVWLEDLAAPYFILKNGGEYITIASPKGGEIPLDLNSQSQAAMTKDTIRFKLDPQAMYHLSHSLPLNEVKEDAFDLLFIAGGYGAMWDFPDNKRLKQILEYFIRQHKPIGLVGHGIVALIGLKMNNGIPFVKDRNLTAFSDKEEELSGLKEKAPFLLESKLRSLGALYSKGPDFTSYILVDDNIVTGQNPASSVGTAKQLLSMVRRRNETYKERTRDQLL